MVAVRTKLETVDIHGRTSEYLLLLCRPMFPRGGTAVWQGEVHKLSVNNGLISTVLGSKASLAGIDFNRALYLEITTDANNDNSITLADPPLLPRQSIIPTVFAIEAASARTAVFATNSANMKTVGV